MAHVPPPSVYLNWPAPNYDNPETRGHGLTVTNAILITVVLWVVLARCYTRLRITGSFGPDDVFIVISLVSLVLTAQDISRLTFQFPALGLMTCAILTESVYGWNRHVWDEKPDDVRNGIKLEFASALLYIWSSVFTKMSVLFFCRRLLSPSHPAWYRVGLNVASITMVFGNLVYTLVYCLSCQPLSAYWDVLPPDYQTPYKYTCIDIPTVWVAGSILNCVIDAIVWLIPLPIVYQLHLPMRQRFAVMALFGVGICVLIASVLKTIYIYQAFVYSFDETWVGWPTWICGAIEIALGIICASAPSLRPFFSHFFPRPGEVFGGARHSYAEMSRGRDTMDPYDAMNVGMATPLSPMAPVHQRLESIGSEDMKPWSYNNSRGSSRNTSRRGSLSKLDTNLPNASRPTSSATTPATLTPGSPVSKRLTPVREIEPISTIFSGDFKFNQTAALPPPSEDEGPDEDGPLSATDIESKSPIEYPSKAASPLWWQRPRTSSNATRNSFGRSISPKLERHPSNKSEKRSLKLKTDVTGAGASARMPHDETPVSTVSTASQSQSAQRHSRKPSAPQEFEMFDFRGPATSSRRGSEATERAGTPGMAAPSEPPPPPPSYGEFVENNSWIREDRSTRRGSIEAPGIAQAM